MIKFFVFRSKALWNPVVNSIAMKLCSSYAPCMPFHITIEPTAFCNLRCTVCETGNGSIGRSQGVMTLQNFKTIIDAVYRHTNTLLLYFMGEPFLNTDIYEMIAYARSKKIYTCVCTNGEFLDPARLVGSGVNEVSFQIGGVTQEVHAHYRKGAHLERALANLEKVVAERQMQGRRGMSVEAGFIVMKHNEHQVREFEASMQRAGVDRVHIIKPRVRTMDQAADYLPRDKRYWLYDAVRYLNGELVPAHSARSRKGCFLLWNSTVVTWNGDLVPCCNDPHGNHVMGNIFKQDLASIWNGPAYRLLRKKVLSSRSAIHMCSQCVE